METTLAHAGCAPKESGVGVNLPLDLSSTFLREQDLSYASGHVYARISNPNRSEFEKLLAKIEGGVECAAFASGSAAISSLVLSLPRPASGGSRTVVIPTDIYHGTRAMLREVFEPWGLKVLEVSMRDVEERRRVWGLEDVSLVILESPSNPMLDVTGVKEIVEEIGGRIPVAVDSTWLSPVLFRPLEVGAQVVIHSTTKLIGGHSDHVGGALVFGSTADPALVSAVRKTQILTGPVMAPFDAYIATRGLRTLAVRVRAASLSALRIAQFLAEHEAVETVLYPGLESHRNHHVACAEQSDGGKFFGSMLSFCVRGDRELAINVAAALNVFSRATSLGGTESLVEHRASVEGIHTKTPDTLLRLSIGLESTNDLIEDLKHALEQKTTTS